MISAPLNWVIQAIAWLPDMLRPGVFLALLVLLAWFVVAQRGLPALWAATCRGTARAVDRTVGLAVLPQYLVATARHRRGAPTENAAANGSPVFSEFADRVLDGAATLYESHQREPMTWKRPPWMACVLLIGASASLWVLMDRLPAHSDAKQELSKAYEHWRDVEAWANVDPDRRAAPGIKPPARPTIVRVRRVGGRVGVRLRCRTSERCRGRLVIESTSGKRIYGRPVQVAGRSTKLLRVAPPGVRADVLRRARVVTLRPLSAVGP